MPGIGHMAPLVIDQIHQDHKGSESQAEGAEDVFPHLKLNQKTLHADSRGDQHSQQVRLPEKGQRNDGSHVSHADIFQVDAQQVPPKIGTGRITRRVIHHDADAGKRRGYGDGQAMLQNLSIKMHRFNSFSV